MNHTLELCFGIHSVRVLLSVGKESVADLLREERVDDFIGFGCRVNDLVVAATDKVIVDQECHGHGRKNDADRHGENVGHISFGVALVLVGGVKVKRIDTMAWYEFGFIVPIYCERRNYFGFVKGRIMKVSFAKVVSSITADNVRVCLSTAVVSMKDCLDDERS